MIKVSIIVPVYNTESYLSKCLDSLITQTLKETEIIIVNDASTDDSQRIIDEYVKKDSRILTIIKEQNEGLGAARNTALKVARGEYIGFVDSDDFVDREMFASLYSKGMESNSDVVVGGLKNVLNGRTIRVVKSEKEQLITGKKAMALLLQHKLLAGTACQKICSRELLLKNKIYFPEGCFREDLLHSFRVFYEADKIHVTKDSYYNYVYRRGSIMSVITHKHIDDMKEAIRSVKQIMQRKNILLDWEEDFYHYLWLHEYHFQALNCVRNPQHNGTPIVSLLEYIYSAMRDDFPPGKPRRLNVKESIIWWAFSSNIFFFTLSYIIFGSLKIIKDKVQAKSRRIKNIPLLSDTL